MSGGVCAEWLTRRGPPRGQAPVSSRPPNLRFPAQAGAFTTEEFRAALGSPGRRAGACSPSSTPRSSPELAKAIATLKKTMLDRRSFLAAGSAAAALAALGLPAEALAA
ncbi:twin-arginine translocation signal domain-containing protein, partial [Variovorax sp. CT11-76]